MPVKRITSQDLDQYRPRYFMLLIGHPGSGKSTDIVHIAEAIYPAKVYCVDTENGVIQLWKNKYRHLDNLTVSLCTNIEDVIGEIGYFISLVKPEDFICVESMARIWEMAQDAGYEKIVGMTKEAWLREGMKQLGSKAVVPDPGMMWQEVKRAYEGGIVNPLRELDPIMAELKSMAGCNILCTTLLAKERPDWLDARRRKLAHELGLSVMWEGSPRLPSYPDTIILTTIEEKKFYAEVLKDRGWQEPAQTIKFEVRNFLRDFESNCRAELCPVLGAKADSSLCQMSRFPECQNCRIRK